MSRTFFSLRKSFGLDMDKYFNSFNFQGFDYLIDPLDVDSKFIRNKL
jgi:hypothetical protein